MRAALLILVLVSGWLGAIPGIDTVAGANDERVHAPGAHDDPALVARLRGNELVRSLEARKSQGYPFDATPLFPLPGSLGLAARQAVAVDPPGRPADRAHRLFVVAQPLLPRAPPPARS